MKQWVELKYTSKEENPAQVGEHGGVFSEEKMYTFGGSTETYSLNSVFVMEPSKQPVIFISKSL